MNCNAFTNLSKKLVIAGGRPVPTVIDFDDKTHGRRDFVHPVEGLVGLRTGFFSTLDFKGYFSGFSRLSISKSISKSGQYK